jgi:hypothetical protein
MTLTSQEVPIEHAISQISTPDVNHEPVSVISQCWVVGTWSVRVYHHQSVDSILHADMSDGCVSSLPVYTVHLRCLIPHDDWLVFSDGCF